jgi:RNA polymerase sigma-70 factor (ECF subfamily)
MTEPQTRSISELVEEERKSLLGFLVMLLGDRPTADEILQETLLEVWRLRDSFLPGTDFGAWARAVARNRAMRHWHARRHLPLDNDLIEKLEAAWVDESAEADPRAALMNECVDALEPGSRRILTLRYHESWPNRRIARDTGRSEDGVKMALSRLRRKLQECVEGKLKEVAP